MILDIFVDFRRDERHAFDAFEQHEVEDGCRGDAPEYSYLPLEVLLVGECEDKTGDVLQDDSEEERYGDGNEYGHDHAERLLRVHQVAYRKSGCVVRKFQQHKRSRASKQLKHKGNRCRGRKSEVVEYVKQDHVRDHHGEEDEHQLLQGEHRRMEYSIPCDFHHSVAHRRSHEHSDSGHDDDCPELGHFGAYR